MVRVSRWIRSLQAQLVLWAILPVSIVLIGLALTGVYTHQQAMHDFVIERDEVVVRMLARQLERALAQDEVSATQGELSDWLSTATAELSGDVAVLDGRGTLIAGVPAIADVAVAGGVADEPALAAGTATVPTPEGTFIVTFAPVGNTGWRIVIAESATDLIGPILRFSGLGPIAAAVAAGLSIIILSFGWKNIVRPLQRLSKAAGEVSWGNYAAIEFDVAGVAEIEELRDALAAMVARLEGYQTGVLDYLDAVTKGQEEERARLARELHDGPIQSLIVLGQRIEMTERLIAQGDTAQTPALLESLRSAEVQVIEELRRITGALRPAYLEDLGFIPGLRTLVAHADARTAAKVRLRVQDNLRRFPVDTELAAYRITQEALSNALQHADADQITVTVQDSDHGILLQINDNGKGFEPATSLSAYTRRGHFGLVGMQERVRHLGGTLEITSTPGDGTTVSVWLPDRAPPSPRTA